MTRVSYEQLAGILNTGAPPPLAPLAGPKRLDQKESSKKRRGKTPGQVSVIPLVFGPLKKLNMLGRPGKNL